MVEKICLGAWKSWRRKKVSKAFGSPVQQKPLQLPYIFTGDRLISKWLTMECL